MVMVVIFALVDKKCVEVAPAENEAFVPVSDVAFRFVLVAPVKNAVVALSAVAKKFVEVAFVVVASVAERFWIVLDAVEMSPPVYEFSAVHVLIEVVAGKSPTTASRASGLEKYRLVPPSVRSSVVAPPVTCPATALSTPLSAPTVRLVV